MSLNSTDIQIFAVLRTHCYVNRRLFNCTLVTEPIGLTNVIVLI